MAVGEKKHEAKIFENKGVVEIKSKLSELSFLKLMLDQGYQTL